MYQGCSDNVKFGIGVSKEFVDSAQRRVITTRDDNGTSLLATSQLSADGMHMINLHNNQAGRQVINFLIINFQKKFQKLPTGSRKIAPPRVQMSRDERVV